MNNQAEQLFGLNPTNPASSNPLSSIAAIPTTGNFTYTRRTSTLTNADYTIWTSTNLSSWTQDTGATQTITSTVNNVQTVNVTLSASLLTGSSRFVRVKAAAP